MTNKKIIDAAIESAVMTALKAIGLDVIKSDPFFGMGEHKVFGLHWRKYND